MKITVFTSNQPRHISLIHKLAGIADEVFAVQECSTLFPGEVQDSIYNQSPVMKKYFDRVTEAERRLFGDIAFIPTNVQTLGLKMGDIGQVVPERLIDALQSDVYVVFGASYIKSPLVDVLIENRAINIHLGVSPYFRGSSCNFWAIQDGYPELVGATIHLLSRGLDSGKILFHALPAPGNYNNPFDLGMKAVEVSHAALCDRISNNTLFTHEPVAQDRSLEIRYSRYVDFNDAVAGKYLQQMPSSQDIDARLRQRKSLHSLVRPFYG